MGYEHASNARFIFSWAINTHKAQLITKELTALDDEHSTAAEALVLPELVGKIPSHLAKLAALAMATVDPEGIASGASTPSGKRPTFSGTALAGSLVDAFAYPD